MTESIYLAHFWSWKPLDLLILKHRMNEAEESELQRHTLVCLSAAISRNDESADRHKQILSVE